MFPTAKEGNIEEGESGDIGHLLDLSGSKGKKAGKAGKPKAFNRKTGATPESFELPFKVILNLLESDGSVHVAAMSADQWFMPEQERESLMEKLRSIHPELTRNLEEEIVSPYHNTRERLCYAGVNVDW